MAYVVSPGSNIGYRTPQTNTGPSAEVLKASQCLNDITPDIESDDLLSTAQSKVGESSTTSYQVLEFIGDEVDPNLHTQSNSTTATVDKKRKRVCDTEKEEVTIAAAGVKTRQRTKKV